MRKIKWTLMILVILAGIFLWRFAIPGHHLTSKAEIQAKSDPVHLMDLKRKAALTYQIIPGINSTWGYDILSANKIIIHQPCIPAVPGNEGFKTREAAEKVAKLVIEKMKQGEMPPTVDIQEMKKLKAI